MSESVSLKVFDLFAIPESELASYSVRLNSSLGEWDITAAYYNDHDALADHAHVVFWEKDEKGQKQNYPLKADRVLQFIRLDRESTEQWLFIGAFRILDGERVSEGRRIANYEPIEKYEPFAGRLVVRYKRRRGPTHFTYTMSEGSKDRTHILENMIVHKIAESPMSARPFPGFEDLCLSHLELEAAVKNGEWKSALESVSAVYLITDKSNGWHYVGSAYSRKGATTGLLSRWGQYASGDFRGGNKHFQQLSSDYIAENFQYSILEIFDRRARLNDVIQRERWWMESLCSVRTESRPFGYNSVKERDAEKGTQE